nr:signal peptidase complex catalytic subunit SEC11 [Seculamonas ecuadoriensis]
MSILQELRDMPKRQMLYQTLQLALVVCSALALWRGLVLLSGSESPVVVVLSESMHPAFERGDLLFLTNNPHTKDMPKTIKQNDFSAGDIVVYKIRGRDIPIVHRIMRVHVSEDGRSLLLTKGDNNQFDDRSLYAQGQMWLQAEDIIGKARGFLPYVGMITIWLNDIPALKFVLIGLLGLLVITSKE